MLKSFQYHLSEVGYRFTRTMRWVQGKALQLTLRGAMGGGAATVATKLSPAVHDAMNVTTATAAHGGTQAAAMTTGGILMSSLGGLVGVGAGIGVSAYLNHMEFRHREKQLCELYRPQIGSILGKSPGLVNVEDLRTVAAGNPTLQTELDRNRDERSLKNTGAILGTAAAFVTVFSAITLAPLLAPGLAVAAAAGFTSVAGAAFFIGAGVLGYATHQFARKVVTKIGNKAKGLDEPSVEDKIDFIRQQGNRVEPERVLDLFLTAKPELAEAVQAEYGKSFCKLTPEIRQRVVEQYDKELGISGIVDALNNDRMNARELAFKVHGQSSGVYPEESWQEKFREAAQQKLDPLQDKWSDSMGKFQQWRAARQQGKLQQDVEKAMEEGKPLPEKAQAIGGENYWRETINARRAAEKAAEGPARV